MRNASVSFTWADGHHTFRLGWGELEMLQEACGAGPYRVLTRLFTDDVDVKDISHVIRIGLIGGGMKPVEALNKVQFYVERDVPQENRMPAQAILSAALYGAPEEGDMGEQEAADQDNSSTTFPTES